MPDHGRRWASATVIEARLAGHLAHGLFPMAAAQKGCIQEEYTQKAGKESPSERLPLIGYAQERNEEEAGVHRQATDWHDVLHARVQSERHTCVIGLARLLERDDPQRNSADEDHQQVVDDHKPIKPGR
eukprot:1212912-Prymnesium_polylepis.1